MTALYLAAKIHSRHKVAMDAVAQAGNGLVEPRHIREMELSLLRCLGWRLHPPTPAAFLDNFLPLVARGREGGDRPGDDAGGSRGGPPGTTTTTTAFRVERAFAFARFLVELSVGAYPFVPARPSSIAVAAVLLGSEGYDLPGSARRAFGAALDGAGLDAGRDEVGACGRMLRRVYARAAHGGGGGGETTPSPREAVSDREEEEEDDGRPKEC